MCSSDLAGSIKDGRQVFGSLVVDKSFTLDPSGANDTTTTYLLVHTAHDGSASVTASITPVRVVCQNTLNMALKGTKQSFKIRHTNGTDSRLNEARRVLGLTFDYMDSFAGIANSLFETPVDSKGVFDMFTAVYPKQIGRAHV